MEFNSLFVVYDPTQSDQPALERAAAITEQAQAAIHLYACIHEDTVQPAGGSGKERQLVDAQKETLNKAVTLLRSRGVSVTTEVEWDKDWYSAVVRASLRAEADLVLKSSYPHSVRERVLKRTSDWTLIRGCQCPVLLVKKSEQRDISKVLAAIDVRDESKSYEQLNEHIIDFSRRIMKSDKAELHFINSFDRLRADALAFQDRQNSLHICIIHRPCDLTIECSGIVGSWYRDLRLEHVRVIDGIDVVRQQPEEADDV